MRVKWSDPDLSPVRKNTCLGEGGGVQPCSTLDQGAPKDELRRLTGLGLGGSTCQPWQKVGQVWHPGSKLGTRERP